VKRFRVEISSEAEEDLDAIRMYVRDEASEEVAERLVDELTTRCEKLSAFPDRGAARDDLAVGVRTIAHKRTVLIVYRVREDVVTVVGFFYRGRDVDSAFREP
jgi:plasmid stabilization system protein ParE